MEQALMHIRFLHWCSAKRTTRLLLKTLSLRTWKAVVHTPKAPIAIVAYGIDFQGTAPIQMRVSSPRFVIQLQCVEHKRNRCRNDGVHE